MTQRVPVEVEADSLATLLLLDKEMEPIPEPIRMQPNVVVIVDFEVYKAFCDRYLSKVDYLSTPTLKLKQLLSSNNTVGLLSAFYYDMSYAVCKELHYAETYKKDATKITHFVADAGMVLRKEDISKTYARIKSRTEDDLREYMAERGFPLPRSFRGENLPLWEYANVLRFYAIATPVKWVFEIL